MSISREEAEKWLFNGCCPCFDVNDHFCRKHKGEIIELLRHSHLTIERVKGMIEGKISELKSDIEKERYYPVDSLLLKAFELLLKEIEGAENE